MSNNLDEYKSVLPYASEIFGVYQPLLGWKSRRIMSRMHKGFFLDKQNIYTRLYKNIDPRLTLADAVAGDGRLDQRRLVEVSKISLGEVVRKQRDNNSFLLDNLKSKMPRDGQEPNWESLLSQRNLQRSVDSVLEKNLSPAIVAGYSKDVGDIQELNRIVLNQAITESQVAGHLYELGKSKDYTAVKEMLAVKEGIWKHLDRLRKVSDPLDYMDPHKDLGRVIISPVSVVHLFRQYFYEFDSFLGTPVGHVWLSPGSQVELVEVSTRKTIVERTFSSEFESIVKSEKESKELDELSTAVKDENQKNTKFGFTTKVHQGWVGGSADASTNLGIESTQKQAREVSHKQMREQTTRLSTQIRNNYKSTFKTVTETTDTSSKRYLLNNTTDKLINYEMRRKMRQVGVQVQDIGTYLCWQTYLDDPGRELGVSKLVHLAEPPELGSIPKPEEDPVPERFSSELAIDIPFVPRTEDTNDSDMDEVYKNGVENDTDFSEGTPEKVKWKFHGFEAVCDQSGFRFDGIEFNSNGNDIILQAYNVDESVTGKVVFSVKVKHVNFRNTSPLRVTAKIAWTPTDGKLADVEAENKKREDQYNAETHRKFKEAYMKAVRERIKLASEVESRDFDDLREEERIVVYRGLIQDMLTKDLPITDDRTWHAVAELLNSIFDIDKMLYFVAPEWWRPRLHRSQQHLGAAEGGSGVEAGASSNSIYSLANKGKLSMQIQSPKIFTKLAPEPVPAHSTVSWGGANEAGRDNYYITEESQPAPLGSSLGWLLQLDGDNMRNAFLNAPWVKAIIPIRPGKERAAFNWLTRVNVEGSDGLDSEYIAPAAELAEIPHSGNKVTIRDAIFHLCDEVRKKHEDSLKTGKYPEDEINDDNKVSATPIDKVYEHGFYPNQGGFKIDPDEPFEVFDQWVEIMPTDQVVPVEVEYDPLTGRLIRE